MTKAPCAKCANEPREADQSGDIDIPVAIALSLPHPSISWCSRATYFPSSCSVRPSSLTRFLDSGLNKLSRTVCIELSDSFIPTVAFRTIASVTSSRLDLINYDIVDWISEYLETSSKHARTCRVFKQPRRSPLATPTSVLRARESALRSSISHISRNRFTTWISAGLLNLIWRACARSFAIELAFASLQMQIMGRRSGLDAPISRFPFLSAQRRKYPRSSMRKSRGLRFFFGLTCVN